MIFPLGSFEIYEDVAQADAFSFRAPAPLRRSDESTRDLRLPKKPSYREPHRNTPDRGSGAPALEKTIVQVPSPLKRGGPESSFIDTSGVGIWARSGGKVGR